MKARLNIKALEKIRVACHQLIEPEFDSPGDLVAWMGALQAQEYTIAKWAIGIRMQSATLRQINEAMARGEIVRTHIMRPTWHFVAGKDVRWMQQLTGTRVKKAVDSWVKSSNLDISENIYTKCNDLIGKMLSGHCCLTREEIETKLDRAGITTSDDRVKRYLLRAEVEGIVCSGADKNGKPTYTLIDEHIPPVPVMHREEALAELALRYFRSHSPATIKDFIWWSGLTVTEAKQAVGLINHLLIQERFREQEFLIYASYREVKSKSILHFLPPYDEYLVSYKERTTVLPLEHYSKAFNNWGTFYPVILYNGSIVGNWKKTTNKETIAIIPSFFAPDLKINTKLLSKAEERYRKFLREMN